MSTLSQMETVDFEDTISFKASTRGTSATREDVLKEMYLRRSSMIVPIDINEDYTIVRCNAARSSVTPSPVAPSARTSTMEQSESEQKTNNILSLPKFNAVPTQIDTRFNVLQEWEGCVLCVSDEEFTASLLDMTNNKIVEEEEVDFTIDDLTEDDKRLLKPGAIFRWLIGYRSIAGTKERISKIVFRRMPQWTAKELQVAQAKAKDISSAIIWE